MSKQYGHNYHFKGENCIVGNMVCADCNKEIDNKKHDWTHCTKDLKHGDWEYVCRHRECVVNQSGWVSLENAEALVKSNADKIYKVLDEFKDEMGHFGREVYMALELHDLI